MGAGRSGRAQRSSVVGTPEGNQDSFEGTQSTMGRANHRTVAETKDTKKVPNANDQPVIGAHNSVSNRTSSLVNSDNKIVVTIIEGNNVRRHDTSGWNRYKVTDTANTETSLAHAHSNDNNKQTVTNTQSVTNAQSVHDFTNASKPRQNDKKVAGIFSRTKENIKSFFVNMWGIIKTPFKFLYDKIVSNASKEDHNKKQPITNPILATNTIQASNSRQKLSRTAQTSKNASKEDHNKKKPITNPISAGRNTTKASNSRQKPSKTQETAKKSTTDKKDISRFITAQDKRIDKTTTIYDSVISELKQGKKTSHWIWFIFPQGKEHGRSDTSIFYGLEGVNEAKKYLYNEKLATRLIKCTELVLSHPTKSLKEIFGDLDAMKFITSMKIFNEVINQLITENKLPKFLQSKYGIFQKALDRYT